MDYLHIIIGGVIGTTVSLTLFANGHRFTSNNWHFFMDGQAKLMRTKNKFLIYAPRYILGGLALPSIFYFIWGPDGMLEIEPLGSVVLSAMLLALFELPLMILGIKSGIMKHPEEDTNLLILLATIGHLNLGFWIGWFPISPVI